MKTYWLKLAEKFDALNHRERVLVTVATVVVLGAILNSLLIDPASSRIKQVADQLATDQTQITLAQQQLQVLESSPIVDPDQQNRQRLERLNVELQGVHQSLDRLQKDLVSPDRMAGLLEDILKKNGQLRLVSLKTLPAGAAVSPGSVAADASSKARLAAPPELAVYRHGVELTVQGGYLDLMNYLATLERMPWHMLWGNMKLTTNAYPQSTLTLTIYTLSLDQAWLSI